MMRWRWLWGCMVLLLCLSGCAAKQAYKRGQAWESSGDPYKAGTEYIFSLDRKSDYPESAAGLKRVAQPGYDAKLVLARQSQRNADFPIALSHFRDLKSYVAGLNRHSALSFAVIDIDHFINNIEVAAAEEEYSKGLTALEARKFGQAVDAFNAALRYKNPFKDVPQQKALAYYAWGETLQDTQKYNQAIQKFLTADKQVDGRYIDSVSRAAAIHVGIARFYLSTRHCQAALERFNQAHELMPSPVYAAGRTQARNCSVRQVAVATVADHTKSQRKTGLAMGPALSNRIHTRAAGMNERYVNVTRVPIRSDAPFGRKLKGYDRVVVGRMDRVGTEMPTPIKAHRQVDGTMWDRCTEGPGLCKVPVVIKYIEFTQPASLHVTATVELMNVHSGNVGWKQEYRLTKSNKVVFTRKFMVDDVAVTVGEKKALGFVQVPDAVMALTRHPKKPDVLKLAHQAMDEISAKAAREVVTRAAKERPPPNWGVLRIPNL